LQFFFTVFLYSKMRVKICRGLGKFENAWRTQVDRPVLPREDKGSLRPSPLSFGLVTPFHKPPVPARELPARTGCDLLPSSHPSRSRLSRGCPCVRRRGMRDTKLGVAESRNTPWTPHLTALHLPWQERGVGRSCTLQVGESRPDHKNLKY